MGAAVSLRTRTRLEGVQDVTPQVLAQAGLVRGRGAKIKVLAEGSLSRAVRVQAHRFSKGAIAKIQAAGGMVEVLDGASAADHESQERLQYHGAAQSGSGPARDVGG